MFEGRHIDYRSSKVDTSITDFRMSTHRSSVFEGQHIYLRRSTHRSSKVDTSISEGRHIDLRRSTHRDIDLRKSTHRSSKIEGGNITPTILSTTALLSPWSRRSYTRSYVWSAVCVKTQNDAGIYTSCWYLRFMLVFTIHAGIYTSCWYRKYQHEV